MHIEKAMHAPSCDLGFQFAQTGLPRRSCQTARQVAFQIMALVHFLPSYLQ